MLDSNSTLYAITFGGGVFKNNGLSGLVHAVVSRVFGPVAAAAVIGKMNPPTSFESRAAPKNP